MSAAGKNIRTLWPALPAFAPFTLLLPGMAAAAGVDTRCRPAQRRAD